MGLKTIQIDNKMYVPLEDYIELLNEFNKLSQHVVLSVPPETEKQETLEIENEPCFSATDIAAELDINAIKLNTFLCNIGFVRKKTYNNKHRYYMTEKYQNKGYDTYVTTPSKNGKMTFTHLRFTTKGKEKILKLYEESKNQTQNKLDVFFDKIKSEKKRDLENDMRLEECKGKNETTKAKAKEIVEIGDNREIEKLDALLWYLQHGSTNEKRLAASAINKLCSAYKKECIVALPFLIQNLKDDAPQVRQYALTALKRLPLKIEDVGEIQDYMINEDRDYNVKLLKDILKQYY